MSADIAALAEAIVAWRWPTATVEWRDLSGEDFAALVPVLWVDLDAGEGEVAADRALRVIGVRFVVAPTAARVVLAMRGGL